MQKAKLLTMLMLSVPLFFTTQNVLAMPSQISSPGEKVIVVDPADHAWGAYDASGRLVKSGVASCGKSYCADTGRACYTRTGSFRIRTLGGAGCKSPSFPLPKGGSPMPYCMYFNETQALHGSYQVGDANLSHGCVRMKVGDAKWIRNNFASIGTLVYIQSY